MRKLSLLLLILWAVIGQAQIYDPVDWEMKSIDKGDGTYDLLFEATMDKGWGIYSQYLEGDDGPIPTSFNYDNADQFDLMGKNEECELNRKAGFDKLFDMEVVKYLKKGRFLQTVKPKAGTQSIVGYLEYMTCDDTKCLPPETVDFEFDLTKAIKAADIKYSKKNYCTDQFSFEVSTGATPAEGDLNEKAQVAANEAKNKTDVAVKEAKDEGSKISVSFGDDQDGSSTSNLSVNLGEADTKDPLSQIKDPVKWTSKLREGSDGMPEVVMTAKVEEGWHMYGPEDYGDNPDAPIMVGFYLDTEGAEVVKQEVTSPHTKKEFDKTSKLNVTKLKKSATAVATIDPKGKKEVVGFLEYAVCFNDRCLPPTTVDFTIDPKAMSIKVAGMDEQKPAGTEMAALSAEDVARLEGLYGIKYSQLQSPVGECVEEVNKANTLLGIFVLGFLGGLLALLTPCVFPMIPLTVSFFTKSSEKKGKGLGQAVFYGLSILAVYLLLSVPFHLLDTIDPNILNNISTNVWLNLAFFAIFIFFAFSFFGYFDLTLPASVTNKVSAAEGIGGVLGIFFMALTLALVSFSCTGPILGSLLAGSLSSEGGAMQLTSGFAGFGVALGLPFGLFAAFPSMMNKLPRSGGWLTTVKVVLGFIELALAFKFLSNADLVKQWGLLKIEPFLIIWILIAIATALYLLGMIRFPHDSPLKKRSAIRWGLAGLFAAAGLYMMTGFRYNEKAGTYHSLSLLSGLAPPVCYSWVYDCKCPQGLDCFKDLKEGLDHAAAVGKPILLDFTGHACVNCRKMEEQVWIKPEVYKYIDNDYVLVSLYVDEKISLPEAEQQRLPRQSGGSKKLRYTGDRWSYFQSEYFKINSQPYYVLMTPEGKLLNNPVGYTPDEGEYADFLECGLENFRQVSRAGQLEN